MTVIHLTITVRADASDTEEDNAHTLKSLLLQLLSTNERDTMIQNISLTINNA